MKDFSFSPEIARLYGVDEAIFVHHLHYWIEHNEANGRNYLEDINFPGVWRHWTFNSADALAALFPFWTKNKIDKLTRKMRANGLIHIGNYNKSKFDRTKWYALSEEILSFYRQERFGQTAESETAERLNLKQPNGGMRNSRMAAPIPDNKPDTYTDDIPDITKTREWADYVEMRKKIKKPMTDRAVELAVMELERLAPRDPEVQKQILNQSVFKSWQGLFPLNRGDDYGANHHQASAVATGGAGGTGPRFGHVAGTAAGAEVPKLE